jgi:large subunit ribosomal protein L19|tara:strand:+ start:635 stop:979 length:345 start_codon:yes stop_codon:yes gene_type:complete
MNKLMPVIEGQLKSDIPEFGAGDTVSIDVRVIEGGKERIQKFEGIVMGRKGSDISETFTVRKISGGIGVERIFPIHSPMLSKIDVKRRGKVRRAKLNYMRKLTGSKATRITEKR